MDKSTRLNKYLADKGIASRREADALIESGKILVNGKKAVVGQKVTEADQVELVGKTKKKQYYAYYKGRGIITHSPASHETDVETKIAKDFGLTGVAPIGRLDKDSEGLLILSNDGRITAPLLSPDSGTEKEYEVLVDKNLSGMAQKIMSKGVDIEGYRTKPAKVKVNAKNAKRFTIVLTEGKKHQIRRMCAALGYQVQTLKRVRVLNIKLGKLKPNQYRKIAGDELSQFLNKLGL